VAPHRGAGVGGFNQGRMPPQTPPLGAQNGAALGFKSKGKMCFGWQCYVSKRVGTGCLKTKPSGAGVLRPDAGLV